jgi:hypothetical protein
MGQEPSKSQFEWMDKRAVTIWWSQTGTGKPVGSMTFFLEVHDPLLDSVLAKNIGDRKPDWLQEHPKGLKSEANWKVRLTEAA